MFNTRKQLLIILAVIFMTAMLAGPAFTEETKVRLIISPAGQSAAGEDIIFKATAEGLDNPEFQFGYRRAGASWIDKAPGPDNTYTRSVPKSFAGGEFELGVRVREAGTAKWLDLARVKHTVNPVEPAVTLTVAPAGESAENEQVSLEAAAAGFVNPEYRFGRKYENGAWGISPAGANSTRTYTPTRLGNMVFGVQVREAGTGAWIDHTITHLVVEEVGEPEELEVKSVEPVIVRVNVGTAFEHIDFPHVELTLCNDSTRKVEAAWDETSSVPRYEKDVQQDYRIEGSLPADLNNPGNIKAVATVTVEAMRSIEKVEQAAELIVPYGTHYEDLELPAQVNVKAKGKWERVDVKWPQEPGVDLYNPYLIDETQTIKGNLDLPDHLFNPGNKQAEIDITVAEERSFESYALVYDEATLIENLSRRTKNIEVARDITINISQLRVRTEGLNLDLDGNSLILLDNASIIFEADEITVINGRFRFSSSDFGLNRITRFLAGLTILAPQEFKDWGYRGVMVDGASNVFEDVTFDHYFRDWYQVQDDPASSLTMINCTFNLPSLFESDVEFKGAKINAALGVSNDDAVVSNPVLGTNPLQNLSINMAIIFEDDLTGDVSILGQKIYENGEVLDNFFIFPDQDFNGGNPIGAIPFRIFMVGSSEFLDMRWTGYSQGMLYISGDIELNNPHWEGDFVGIYIGKDLKYYGEYSKTRVTMNGGKVTSTKYQQPWIALQHDKAELTITGEVDVSTDLAGLVFVGRGLVNGDATFTGGSVYFGWQTLDFIDNRNWTATEMRALYKWPHVDLLVDIIQNGMLWDIDDDFELDTPQRVKAPPAYVDYQAACKDSCQLTVVGITFESDAYVFDNSLSFEIVESSGYIDFDNDIWQRKYYYWTEKLTIDTYFQDTPDEVKNNRFDLNVYPDGGLSDQDEAGYGYYPWGGVMLGNVKFDGLYLWGNITIVDGMTVEFKEMRLECGKKRSIFTAWTGTSFGTVPPCCYKDRSKPEVDKDWRYPNNTRGTLVGGVVTTDTKQTNYLIFGDGLLVKDAVLRPLVYWVEVRSATLENVTIKVGDSAGSGIINGEPWLYSGIYVPQYAKATFNDVMWSEDTEVIIEKWATLVFKGTIDNQGMAYFSPEAAVEFADGVSLTNDVREGHEIWIRSSGGRAYFDVIIEEYTDNWYFDDWKLDIELTIDNPVSTKYELRMLHEGPVNFAGGVDNATTTWFIDYRDPDLWSFNITEGAWLREILGVGQSDALGYESGLPLPLLTELGWVDEKALDKDEAIYPNRLQYRLSLAEDRELKVTVRVSAVNCCTKRQFDFATGSRTLDLKGKFDCSLYANAVQQLRADQYWQEEFPWLQGWRYRAPEGLPFGIPYDGYIVMPANTVSR